MSGSSVNTRLRKCVLGNFVILILIFSLVIIFNTNKSTYWRFGPHSDFILISVVIDNWVKYGLLLILVGILKVSQCIIAEVAHPIIGFNIYNPDKKEITEFTKIELQIYGNAMYTIDAIRNVLMIMMSITQIDIALWGVVCSEITSIFTIRMLLDDKSFKPTNHHSSIPDNNIIEEEDEISDLNGSALV